MSKRKEQPNGSKGNGNKKSKKSLECKHTNGCKKSVGDKRLLKEHYRRYHIEYCTSKCDLCDEKRRARFACQHVESNGCKDYASRQSLWKHYDSFHIEYCKESCGVCEKKRKRIEFDEKLSNLYKKIYNELYGDDQGDEGDDGDQSHRKYDICRHSSCSYGEKAILKSNLARHYKTSHNCNDSCIKCQN